MSEENPITPADARTFLADYVHDAAALKTMPDADVVKYHGRVTAANQKVITGYTEKQKADAETARAGIKYELKLPEGSPLGETDVERTVAYAKKQGLSNEQAALMLDSHTEAVAGFQARVADKLKGMRVEWKAAVAADKELGGEHAVNVERNIQAVTAKFLHKELADHMEKTGMIDHPEVKRFLNKIGAAMAEDRPLNRLPNNQQQSTAANKLYGATA